MSVNSFREDEQQKEVLKMDTLLRLYRYLFYYKKEIILILLIMAGTTTIELINPLIIERAIDVNIANNDMQGLYYLGIFALVINIIFMLGTKLRMRMMAKVSNKILLEIRQELYTHIQKLTFDFFDSRPTGKILARVIGDVNALRDVLESSVTTLIPDFITLIGVLIIMIVKDIRLAMAAILVLPFLAFGMYFIQSRSHKCWRTFRHKTSNLNAFVHENLSGIQIIQSFTAEEKSQKDFNTLLNEQKNAFVAAITYADAFGPIIDISWGAGGFLLYFIAVKFVGIEDVSVGTLLAFATYLAMFWRPLRNLSNFYNKLITNLSGAERIFDIMDTRPDISDGSNAAELPDINGEVEFKHVSFSYDDNVNVLDDVSFHADAGETIALVGTTGAGKSTIINLLARFYDIQEGMIYIDGYNIRSVTMESLRNQMGIMTQENFLFSGTIKENIRYGKLDATDEEVIAAAKAVSAHEFVMGFENGYDTEISERGVRLSIGQRQLIAFARTMIAKPRILILDEATSSIDTHTEILVQKGIEALLKGRTSFIIAHRLSTIQKADRIFVIDQGKIMEQGNHEELLEKQGLYYNLYQAQFKY
ncbi:MAG: ABC transporter ATP-binding protein [Lachnospiraceae bacterium]